MTEPTEHFISEPIEPVAGTFDARTIGRGEPGLPQRFVWRGEAYAVGEVLAVWKTSSPDTTGEVYLRRHWWEVRTDIGHVMKLYFERQKNRKNAQARWFVFTVIDPSSAGD